LHPATPTRIILRGSGGEEKGDEGVGEAHGRDV
jgi:hypothetical protein